jgi:hypothetical protein
MPSHAINCYGATNSMFSSDAHLQHHAPAKGSAKRRE